MSAARASACRRLTPRGISASAVYSCQNRATGETVARRGPRIYGRGYFAIPAGQTERVKTFLTKTGKKLLEERRKVRSLGEHRVRDARRNRTDRQFAPEADPVSHTFGTR